MHETMSLFTELTPSEEASLSGGTKLTNKLKQLLSYGNITGAGGGAGSGGTIGGGSSNATAGSGVVIVLS